MAGRGGQNWISAGVAIALVAISAAAMLVFLALSAYAPELRSETGGRANVLSKSAIGFAGLRILLEELGTDTFISRSRDPEREGLLILTPDANAPSSSVVYLASERPSLIILPKWPAFPNPLQAGWVVKFRSFEPVMAAAALKGLDPTTEVTQDRPAEIKKPAPKKTAGQKMVEKLADPAKSGGLKRSLVRLAGSAAFGPSPFAKPLAIDNFQTVSGKLWVADITDGKGRAVLAHIKGSQTYVLSDPDLINTAALKDESVAAGAMAMIQRLPYGNDYAIFDVTLAGLDAPPSLLHAVFAPPFLAATLCALLAAAFLAFRAVNRFGTPRGETREFAFGKRSLADNTAGLIRVMGRGPGMAPRYAQAMRRIAAKALRRGKPEDVDWLDAVERAGRISPSYSELLTEAGTVETQSHLMALAAKLQDWKARITHARSGGEK